MVSFFKACGKGVLYIIIFPFAIALVCVYGVVGVLIFAFLIIKSILLFFKGQTIFSDLPEDIEAKRILAEREARLVQSKEETMERVQPSVDNNAGPLSLYPSDSNMYKSEFQHPSIEPEPINPMPTDENSINEQFQNNHIPVLKEPEIEIEKEEDVIGTYKPLSSNNKDQQ